MMLLAKNDVILPSYREKVDFKQTRMALSFAKIFVLALAISFSYCEKSSRKVYSTDEKHEQGKLSLQKRSVYSNPLMVYRCSLPLGLENGHVPDAAFSASSSANSKHGPARSRLNIQSNSKGYGAWSAGANNGKQWLQIDFGELVRVTKVATQGRQDSGQWVTKYTLSYSVDGMHWAEYKEKSVTWVFPANKDRNTVVEHLLLSPFDARLIRFHPKTYHGYTSMRAEVYGCRKVHSCSVPLGVEDERIPDSAFTASGSYDNRHRPSLARLNLLSDGKHVGAWCPKLKSRNQWLQIDLGEITAVTKVATQGRYNSEDRTRTYTLSYSVDGLHWTSYKQRAVEKVFAGNTDRNTAIIHSLKPHIEARCIRFHPRAHNHNIPCLRVELYGCRKVKNCLMAVGVEDGRIPDEAFTASSSASGRYLPNRGRLNLPPSGGKYCWAAGQNNANQWLQVNLGRLFNVRGVATQGRHDANQWVTSFSLSYTADDFTWVFIKENSQVKTFLANSDRTTVVKHVFSLHIRLLARSVRFHPKGWQSHISMRVEIYGCKEDRSCFLPLGMESGHLPDSAISASTYHNSKYIPQLSRLNNIPSSGKAGVWCTRTNNGNEWLQVNFGRETTVTKVATQGMYKHNNWITSYSLSYSVDGSHWAWYRLSDGHIKVFGGNIDRHTPINLGYLFNVRGVATQGRHDSNQWVTSFSLSYTADDFMWVFIKENSQVKTFLANSDRTTVVKHVFSPHIRAFARSVRFHPKR
ncbi:uncharacterized protein LOC113679072 [Pocillopora damicornis]|uniref:uncharacterized protein LOC113679072 n=1 Tax=Pocillopora damicornis TaxID=46731 RepID=UPI000F555DF4|nr:uncharacterized protein LOC113679072 [Pocillopora damicornis]